MLLYCNKCIKLIIKNDCLIESLFSLSSGRLPLMQAHRRMMLPVHSLVCLAVFGLSLPLAISLFPQMSEVLQQHLHHFLSSSMANNCCSRFNFVCRPLAINLFMCVCVCALNNKYFSRELLANHSLLLTDRGISPWAGNCHGNRLQGADLQQGTVMKEREV